MKIKGPVWDFFIVTKRKLDGTPLRVKCKTCGWVIFANAKRMSEHACKGKATLPGEDQSVPENRTGPGCSSSSTSVSLEVGNSSGPSPATMSDALHTSPSLSLSEHLPGASQQPPKKSKLQLLSQFLDHTFTLEAQAAAERA